MIDQLIYKYKNLKKQSFLDHVNNYSSQYAFVGVGGHSISNLYPVIDYFRIPLRYIVTRNGENASKMALRYANCKGTSNLDSVLDDSKVKGVFVSTNPASHYTIVKKCLEKGKNVFVEKPPCFTSEELKNLIALESDSSKVVVGFQKRYSTIAKILKKKLKKDPAKSYNLKFCTGAYPEGDAILDLFIHPLDLIIYLFGEVEDVKGFSTKTDYQLTFKHKNGTIGGVTFSTSHSWKKATESIEITSKNGIYESVNNKNLVFTPTGKTILGVPLEKVIASNPTQEILYQNNGFVPLSEFNSIHEQGYSGEISAFISLVEGNDKAKNISSLQETKKVFELIDKLRKL